MFGREPQEIKRPRHAISHDAGEGSLRSFQTINQAETPLLSSSSPSSPPQACSAFDLSSSSPSSPPQACSAFDLSSSSPSSPPQACSAFDLSSSSPSSPPQACSAFDLSSSSPSSPPQACSAFDLSSSSPSSSPQAMRSALGTALLVAPVSTVKEFGVDQVKPVLI